MITHYVTLICLLALQFSILIKGHKGHENVEYGQCEDIRQGFFKHYYCTLQCFGEVLQLSYVKADLCKGHVALGADQNAPVPLPVIGQILECITDRCRSAVPPSVCGDDYRFINKNNAGPKLPSEVQTDGENKKIQPNPYSDGYYVKENKNNEDLAKTENTKDISVKDIATGESGTYDESTNKESDYDSSNENSNDYYDDDDECDDEDIYYDGYYDDEPNDGKENTDKKSSSSTDLEKTSVDVSEATADTGDDKTTDKSNYDKNYENDDHSKDDDRKKGSKKNEDFKIVDDRKTKSDKESKVDSTTDVKDAYTKDSVKQEGNTESIKKESSVEKYEDSTKSANESFDKKDGVWKQKDDTLEKKDGALEKKDGALEKKDDALEKKDGALEKKDGALKQKDDVVKKKDGALEQKDGVLKQKDDVLENKDGALKQKDALDKKDGALKQKDDVLDKKDDALKQKDGVLEKKDGAVKQKDDVLEKKDGALEKKDGVLEKKDGAVKQKDDVLEKKDGALEKKDGALKQKDDVVKKKDGALKQKDDALKQEDEEVSSPEQKTEDSTPIENSLQIESSKGKSSTGLENTNDNNEKDDEELSKTSEISKDANEGVSSSSDIVSNKNEDEDDFYYYQLLLDGNYDTPAIPIKKNDYDSESNKNADKAYQSDTSNYNTNLDNIAEDYTQSSSNLNNQPASNTEWNNFPVSANNKYGGPSGGSKAFADSEIFPGEKTAENDFTVPNAYSKNNYPFTNGQRPSGGNYRIFNTAGNSNNRNSITQNSFQSPVPIKQQYSSGYNSQNSIMPPNTYTASQAEAQTGLQNQQYTYNYPVNSPLHQNKFVPYPYGNNYNLRSQLGNQYSSPPGFTNNENNWNVQYQNSGLPEKVRNAFWNSNPTLKNQQVVPSNNMQVLNYDSYKVPSQLFSANTREISPPTSWNGNRPQIYQVPPWIGSVNNPPPFVNNPAGTQIYKGQPLGSDKGLSFENVNGNFEINLEDEKIDFDSLGRMRVLPKT